MQCYVKYASRHDNQNNKIKRFLPKQLSWRRQYPLILRQTFWFSVAYISAVKVQIYKKCSQQSSKNRNNKSCYRIFFSCLFHHASFILFTTAQQASRDETDKRDDLDNPHISDIKRSLLRKISVSKGSLYCGVNFKRELNEISCQRGTSQHVKKAIQKCPARKENKKRKARAKRIRAFCFCRFGLLLFAFEISLNFAARL